MKAIARMLVMFFFPALLILSGCEKPDGPTPIDIPTATLKASATPDVVDFNGESTITYISTKLDSLYCNNEEVIPNGGFQLSNLKRDTVLNFIGYYLGADKLTITVVVKITVRPEVLPDPPFLSATAVWDTIEYGQKSVVRVISDGDSIISDLPSFTGVSGNFTTPNLFETTTYIFTAYNKGGETTDSATFVVKPLVIPTRMDTLCSTAWVVDSLWYRYAETDEWTYLPPSQAAIYAWVLLFKANGRVYYYRLPDFDELGTGGSEYYFVGTNDLFWPYEIKHIEELSSQKFVYNMVLVADYDSAFIRVKNIPITIP